MKNLLIYTFVLLVASIMWACTDEAADVQPDTLLRQNNELKGGRTEALVGMKNGRIFFETRDELINTLAEFSLYQPAELDQWERKVGFFSLRRYNLENRLKARVAECDFPDAYATILNEQGEFQVGDTIVAFKNGYQYRVHEEDAAVMESIRKGSDPRMLRSIRSRVSSRVVPLDISRGRQKTVVLYPQESDWDDRYRHTYLNNGTNYKIVFEVIAWTDNYYFTEARLQVYLHYYHKNWIGGRWTSSDLARYITLRNLDYNTTLITNFLGIETRYPFSGRIGYYSTLSNDKLYIRLGSGYTGSYAPAKWEITLAGDIEVMVPGHYNFITPIPAGLYQWNGYYRERNAQW